MTPTPTTTERERERKASALFTFLKSNTSWCRLFLAEIGGEMWWSDAHLMLKVDDAMAALLARYNLPPEPMVCEVRKTIVRTEAPPTTQLPALLAKYAPKRGMVDVAPLEFGGLPLMQIQPMRGTQQVLWSTDGVKVTHRLNASKLAVVEAGGGDRWRVAVKVPNAALVRFDGKVPVGLLMPMRGAEGALGIDLGQSEQVAA